jgi:hypothetical protein
LAGTIINEAGSTWARGLPSQALGTVSVTVTGASGMRDSVTVTLNTAADPLRIGTVKLLLVVEGEVMLGVMVIMPGEMCACRADQAGGEGGPGQPPFLGQ